MKGPLPPLLLSAISALCLACGGGVDRDAGPPATGAGIEGEREPAAAAPGTPATAAPAAPAALVNGVPISRKALDTAMRLLLQSQGTSEEPPEAELEEMRRSMLQNLIARELLYQKAAGAGALPSQAEIDEAVARTRAPFPNEEAWKDHLRSQGVEEAAFIATIARTLAVERYLKREIFDRIEISDADVRRYYTEHPDEMKREGQLVPLEEVSENLRAFLRQKRTREEVEALVASLRASAAIVID